jgi:hypothetical protein
MTGTGTRRAAEYKYEKSKNVFATYGYGRFTTSTTGRNSNIFSYISGSQCLVILEKLKENVDTYLITFEYNHHDASSFFRAGLPRAGPDS